MRMLFYYHEKVRINIYTLCWCIRAVLGGLYFKPGTK
ncbi:MAG: hypothetical protein JWQ54_3484 [Mucilaginibacter sp.]|nr:hypothetical protein [Mucilaginibacter sp.]